MARETSTRSHKGEVESISIRPIAKGEGVISSVSMKYKRGGQGGGPMHDYESEEHHHPTLEHLHAHIEKHMGHCFSPAKIQPKPSGEEEE